jgi:hypothetical protein
VSFLEGFRLVLSRVRELVPEYRSLVEQASHVSISEGWTEHPIWTDLTNLEFFSGYRLEHMLGYWLGHICMSRHLFKT